MIEAGTIAPEVNRRHETLVLCEPCTALPLVNLGITFRSGRVHEPAGKEGLARVTARMLRRGAAQGGAGGAALSADDIERELDSIGAELYEHVALGITTFSCDVLARSLAPAVDLFTRLFAAPTFPEDELGRLLRQSEAQLVQARDDDSLLAGRALRRHLFADHPHGWRVIGTSRGLAAITAADVRAFARRHYVKGGAIVHVSGDIAPAHAEEIALRLTAALPAGDAPDYPAGEPPPPRGRRLVIVDKPERTQTQLGVGTLGSHPLDDDYIAMLVANAAFGGTFSSRLTQEIRQKRGWSYGAASQLSTGRVRETFNIWTAPAREDAAACLELELALLEAWCKDGIDAAELAFCQNYLVRSYAFEIDTAHKRLQQQLERALMGLPDDFHARFRDRVMAVTRDEASAAVARRIHPQDLWVSAVATAAESQADLVRACGELAEVVVEPSDLE
jgi:zinc protease